jgi:hypothetical protein
MFAQQTAGAVLKRIGLVYENATVMSFQAHMKMYPAATPSLIKSTLEVSCVMNKNRSYTRLGPVEIIRDARMILAVDHEEKTVMLTSSQEGAANNQLSQQVFNVQQFLESLEQSGAVIQQFIRASGSYLELSGLSTPGIHKCNILYDPSSYLIKKVWMQIDGELADMTAPGVVEISYDHYQSGEPPADRFSTSRFVHINGTAATLQEKYKNYTLINQL